MKALIQRIRKIGFKASTIFVVIIAFGFGYFLGQGETESRPPRVAEVSQGGAGQEVQIWTCSMHPQIRQPKPGKCPICGMDLIPATTGESSMASGPRELRLSPAAEKLAEIEVAPVERKHVTAEIRMVGKVEYDETRLAYITAWVPGRIDRLYVDYTGVPVKKGDHMVYLYSPELVAAQQELIQAVKTAKELERSNLAVMRETAQATIDAAREKLRLWGLTQEQIEQIERRGTPTDHMTIYAPISGIVVHKNALEGMYVNTGTRIYTIADLSHVWVKMDAYESDLAWIRYGQEVEFNTEAYPGEIFRGKIAFIDPVLNEKTRTVKVRVNVPNPEGKLKPEMFVRAVVRARVAAGGKVMDPDLAGKWICPMHPEVVKNGAGTCNICEMPLVRTETLGFATSDTADTEVPLVIPSSAPLITGKRAIVYVAVPGKKGTYEGREIVLGPRAGDYYLVKEGLREGELVVVNGNFKIDSAIQIIAKPSMMSPEGGAPAPGHAHGEGQRPAAIPPAKAAPAPQAGIRGPEEMEQFETPDAFKKQVAGVFSAYFEIQQALSADNASGAKASAKKMQEVLAKVDMSLLKDHAHMVWMKEVESLKQAARDLAAGKSIEKIRSDFALLSETLIAVAKRFETVNDQPIIRFRCPMAFQGRGADWLQNKPGTENPYFGEAMLGCGEQVEVINSGPDKRRVEE